MQFEIKQGMNQDILKSYPDNHFDSIVTDPPYGIEFLGKDWDSNTGAVETWQECLRVLKPGGYLLAFSAARTYHHLATNIESVGFEIRDQLMWIYASGFPKAQDIGKAIERREGKRHKKPDLIPYDNKGADSESLGAYRGKCPKCLKDQTHQLKCNDQECVLKDTTSDNEWAGWKTALKPGHEPIVMARKPFKGSTIDNVLEYGTGALNIDATRIPLEEGAINLNTANWTPSEYSFGNAGTGIKEDNLPPKFNPDEKGRFPSNVLGDIPDYQKYFYCPKVSRRERHCGFEQKTIPTTSGGMYDNHGTGKMYSIGTDMKTTKDPLAHISTGDNFGDGLASGKKLHKTRGNDGIPPNKDYMVEAIGGSWVGTNMIDLPHKGKIYVHGLKHEYELWCKENNVTPPTVGNNHPTVKPVELMKYLIKLVTPPNSKVLDPFTGSGSTGMAAVDLGHEFTGCELDPAYVSIAETRIRAWNDHGLGPLFE